MPHLALSSTLLPALQVSFADGATNDLQALQDEVQSRYLDLLRQVESGGINGGGATSVPLSHEEMSGDDSNDGELMTPEALAAFLVSAREELMDLRTMLAQEDQFWAVIDHDHADTATVDAAATVFVPLEERTEAEREALLGPMPAPMDPSLARNNDHSNNDNNNDGGETSGHATTTTPHAPAPATSMKALKSRVDTALLDLSMRRRGEVLLWEANDALRLTAKSTRKVTQKPRHPLAPPLRHSLSGTPSQTHTPSPTHLHILTHTWTHLINLPSQRPLLTHPINPPSQRPLPPTLPNPFPRPPSPLIGFYGPSRKRAATPGRPVSED